MGGRDRAGLDLPPDMERRQDIEQCQALDPAGLIECKAVADARAAVMPDDGEAHITELLHDCDHVAAHGAFGVDLVFCVATWDRGPTVAAQVQTHDRMCL